MRYVKSGLLFLFGSLNIYLIPLVLDEVSCLEDF